MTGRNVAQDPTFIMLINAEIFSVGKLEALGPSMRRERNEIECAFTAKKGRRWHHCLSKTME